MNNDVLLMKAKPGRYAISNSGFKEHGFYLMVEVDEHGTVYQLTGRGERDGVLGDDKWPRDARVYVTDAEQKAFVRIGDPK